VKSYKDDLFKIMKIKKVLSEGRSPLKKRGLKN
jgi:hypothetical protein